MTVQKSRKFPIRLTQPQRRSETPLRLSEITYLPPPTPQSPRLYPIVSGDSRINVKAPHWSPRLYHRLSPMYNLPPPQQKTPSAPRMTPMYNLPPPNINMHNWTPKQVAQIAYMSPKKSPIIAAINVAGIAKTLNTTQGQVKSIVKNVLAGDLIRDNVEKHVLSEDHTKKELTLQMSVLSNVPKTDQTLVSKVLDGVKNENPAVWRNILSGFNNNKFYAIALGAVIIAAGVYVKYAYFTKPETWTEMIIRYVIESFYGKPAYSLYRLSVTIDLVKKNSNEILEKVTAPFKRLLGIYTAPPELSKVAKAIKYGRALSWLLLMITPEFMGFHQLMFGTAVGVSYAAGPVGNVVERIFGGRKQRKLRKAPRKRVLRRQKK